MQESVQVCSTHSHAISGKVFVDRKSLSEGKIVTATIGDGVEREENAKFSDEIICISFILFAASKIAQQLTGHTHKQHTHTHTRIQTCRKYAVYILVEDTNTPHHNDDDRNEQTNAFYVIHSWRTMQCVCAGLRKHLRRGLFVLRFAMHKKHSWISPHLMKFRVWVGNMQIMR